MYTRGVFQEESVTIGCSYFFSSINSINCLSEIFSLNFNLVNFLITIISNIVYISLGVFVVTKMFDNEKVMFN